MTDFSPQAVSDHELRHKANAATQGEREYEYKTGITAYTPTGWRACKATVILCAAGDRDLDVSDADGAFIAACDPGTIIGLLDRLRLAEARAMPVLPEGWRIDRLDWRPTQRLYAVVLKKDGTTESVVSTGATPTEAIAKALSYVEAAQ